MRTIKQSARRLFVTVGPGQIKAAQTRILGIKNLWARDSAGEWRLCRNSLGPGQTTENTIKRLLKGDLRDTIVSQMLRELLALHNYTIP
jgi:hypothetical protein